eukprot:m.114359 g.114359  ORF g.114359 m.114359 type:complete len:217 (+) comp14162_c0_seq3:393-1043(+)
MEERPRNKKRRCKLARWILLLWLVLVSAAWGLIMAVVFGADLVHGTETEPIKAHYSVGLLRQCRTYEGLDEQCVNVPLGKMNNDLWSAAAIMFIIAILFLTLCIGAIAASSFSYSAVFSGKVTQALGQSFLFGGAVLLPAGYRTLDDLCPENDDEQIQCGLRCMESGEMDWFELCNDFEPDIGMWMVLGSIVCMMVATIVSTQVRLPTESKKYCVN